MRERLLIVGGSVRAAAMSARRAGFKPLAIDRFMDADLRHVCSNFRQYDDLRQLPQLARELPTADWMFTGPLENYPRLIGEIGMDRALLGCTAASLHRVRDPETLTTTLRQAGLQVPQFGSSLPVPGGWLRKPLLAAGGFGVERLESHQSNNHDTGRDRGAYYQEFISGSSVGATFIAANGQSILLGATEQLAGHSWGAAREFQYVGSVGPIALSDEQRGQLSKIGSCIAANFTFSGLFGVDAVVNDEGVWPVEVNPRYTASVEIHERALNVATIRWHVAACRHGQLPAVATCTPRQSALELHGKAIVYATKDTFIDARIHVGLAANHHEEADPILADIPMLGAQIKRGDPIATVFAHGKTLAETKERLRSQMDRLTHLVVHDD